MQGYEQTAEISRRIIEMAQSDKLADILHIGTTASWR
jgi:hypothetical protein